MVQMSTVQKWTHQAQFTPLLCEPINGESDAWVVFLLRAQIVGAIFARTVARVTMPHALAKVHDGSPTFGTDWLHSDRRQAMVHADRPPDTALLTCAAPRNDVERFSSGHAANMDVHSLRQFLEEHLESPRVDQSLNQCRMRPDVIHRNVADCNVFFVESSASEGHVHVLVGDVLHHTRP